MRRRLKVLLNDLYNTDYIIESLQAENRRYRNVFAALPQPVFIKDDRLCYVLCNSKYASDLSKTVDEIVGKTDEDLIPSELANIRRQQETRILESCQPEETEERPVIDGQQKVYLTIRTPLNGDRPVSGILGMSVDISAHWREVLELNSLNRQMENLLFGQSQRIERMQNELDKVVSEVKLQEEKFNDQKVDYEKKLSLQEAELLRVRTEIRRDPSERTERIQALQKKLQEMQTVLDRVSSHIEERG